MSKKKDQKKFAIYSVFLGLGVGVLAFLNIVFSAQVSTVGEKIKTLNQEAEVLKEVNQQLEAEFLALGSLHSLEEKAQELGFVERPEVVTVTLDTSVALR